MDARIRKDTAGMIRAFISDTCDPWDWDDFISPERRDAEEDEVVSFCVVTEDLYPGVMEGCWCSEEGSVKMRELAELLDSSVPFEVISDFIHGEYERRGWVFYLCPLFPPALTITTYRCLPVSPWVRRFWNLPLMDP